MKGDSSRKKKKDGLFQHHLGALLFRNRRIEKKDKEADLLEET